MNTHYDNLEQIIKDIENSNYEELNEVIDRITKSINLGYFISQTPIKRIASTCCGLRPCLKMIGTNYWLECDNCKNKSTISKSTPGEKTDLIGRLVIDWNETIKTI